MFELVSASLNLATSRGLATLTLPRGLVDGPSLLKMVPEFINLLQSGWKLLSDNIVGYQMIQLKMIPGNHVFDDI